VGLRKQATRGVAWSALERWGSQLLGLAVFAVLARKLDPAAFGLVALAGVMLEYVRVFVDQGFSEAVIQRANLEPEHLDTAFWTGLLTGAVLAAACALGAVPIARMLGDPALAPVLRWLSLGFVISGLSSTQAALLQRRLAFRELAARSFMAQLGSGSVAIYLALEGYGVWALVGHSLADAVFGVVTLWTVSGWRPGFNVRWRHFRELSGFGASIVGFKLLNLISQRSDMVMIGSLLGSVALGYYTVAWRIFHAMTKLLTSVMNRVAFPVFARLQQEPERLRSAFYEATQLTSLVTFPAFLGLAALAPDVLPWAFGAKWVESVPVMRVLAFVGILQSLTHFNGSLIKGAGKPVWRLGIASVQATVNVAAVWLGVQHGITGVAIAVTLAGFALYPLGFFAVRRLTAIEPLRYASQFVAPLLAAALCVAVALGVRHALLDAAVPVRVALAAAAGALSYLLGLRLVAPALWRRAQGLIRGLLPGTPPRRTAP
jgi:O-antigen/teichoic acid export membrane protein